MKTMYTVENIVNESGFDYKEFESLKEARKEIDRRLSEKSWTRQELIKNKPYILLSEVLADDEGEIVEYVDSIKAFYYAEKNAVL